MTELDQIIAAAFTSQGKQEDVNKVYLALVRANLFIPITKEKNPQDAEPFRPLFVQAEGQFFMAAFDTLERLSAWAGDNLEQIDYIILSGRDVVAGINEQVFLCLNIGNPYYKEFSPDEIKRLKMIVARLDQLKE